MTSSFTLEHDIYHKYKNVFQKVFDRTYLFINSTALLPWYFNSLNSMFCWKRNDAFIKLTIAVRHNPVVNWNLWNHVGCCWLSCGKLVVITWRTGGNHHIESWRYTLETYRILVKITTLPFVYDRQSRWWINSKFNFCKYIPKV